MYHTCILVIQSNIKIILNKKILLRERKRHTARRVASARYAALFNGGGGLPHPVLDGWRGVPYPVLDGGGVTPSSPGWGEGGTPSRPGQGVGVPHPVLVQGGTPHPELEWGTPCQLDGIPPPQSRPGMEYHPSRPGMGYPPPHQLDGDPPCLDLGWVNPPPSPMVNRQTFPSINITFPRTMYAGGKNVQISEVTHITYSYVNILH